MKTLYLHAGHPKTGSSFLQAALALSAEALSGSGILYPDMTNSFARAKKGHITAGNVHAIRRPIPDYLKELGEIEQSAVLFSNEGIFSVLRKGNLSELVEDMRELGYQIKVLCFIRNPLDHAVSAYQQFIKRHGYSTTFGPFLAKYDMPLHVSNLLTDLQNAKIEAKFVNYSKQRNDITGIFEDWLGLNRGFLKKIENISVNRSLSTAELELQRIYNTYLGQKAAKIADALCNELPNINSGYPPLSRSDLSVFLEKIKKSIKDVNVKLPDAEAYEVPDIEDIIEKFPDPDEIGPFTFSHQQLEVVARSVSCIMKDPQKRSSTRKTDKNSISERSQ